MPAPVRLRENLADLFFRRIIRDPNSTCVLWIGTLLPSGYGTMRVSPRKDGVNKRAHHISWFLKHGYWPTYLMHSCDNPACVKIAHLREATHAENMADMVAKDRQYRPPRPTADLADKAGVHPGTIWQRRKRGVPEDQVALPPSELPRKKSKPYKPRAPRPQTAIEKIAASTGLTVSAIQARMARGLKGADLVAPKHKAPRKTYTRRT